MSDYYRLVGEDAVPCSPDEWARGRELSKRVNWTQLGESVVSTVFLGLDHRFGEGGPPLIFETMVFGGVLDQEQDRYSTLAEARAGHEAMCERVNLYRACGFAFA